MHRFFLSQTSLDKETIALCDPQEIHHLKNVLRLKSTQQIRIFNTEGQEIVGTITLITKNHIEIRRDYVIPLKKKRPMDLVLACAIPKRAKFEFIIEKCTELGVAEIIPLKTARTEVLVDNERVQKKKDRYQTVAVNAAKQCGRRDVPKILPICSIEEVLKSFDQSTLMLVACLSAVESLLTVLEKQDLKKFKRIIFFIGPEGDFTKEEVDFARQLGCIGVSLGSTVLKVDTAAIAIVSCANLYLDHAFNRV